MGVVGPSSVADGLPLLHLSPYLSPPLPFSTAVVRLVALQIQVRPHFHFLLKIRVDFPAILRIVYKLLFGVQVCRMLSDHHIM